jgi:hypothetical protein
MKYRRSLFWDTDPTRINAKKNARYVIERVLDMGEPEDVRSLLAEYSKDEIKRVVALPRVQLSPKSKALWSLLLSVQSHAHISIQSATELGSASLRLGHGH